MGRVAEQNRFALGAEREAELGFVVNYEAARRQNRHGRDDKLVRIGVIAQEAAGDVQRLRAVVVKLDEIQLGRVGMRQKFVDDYRAQRVRCHGVESAG